MAQIELTTVIHAPIERCFDLSRSIDLHLKSTELTLEKVVAGRASGLIELNETVQWRGRHFGLHLTHESLVDRFDPPHYFRDLMIAGTFKRFEHEHFFRSISSEETEMKDILLLEAPTLLGPTIDALFLRNYIQRFLETRNRIIKRVAESDEWRKYLPANS